MFSNVVVGVDGQPGGTDAAALAALLKSRDARVTAVHVSVVDPVPGRGSNPDFLLATEAEAQELIETHRSLFAPEAEWVRRPAASVGEGLESVAAEQEAELIVVGSCHRNLLGRVLMGDDAASVLHHARHPVALAPAGFSTAPHIVRRVGLAYDGSPESEVARACALRLASGLEAEVMALEVVPPHVNAVAVGAAAAYYESPDELIARTEARHGNLEGIRFNVAVGLVNEELEAFSEQVDVLVCGSRHNDAVRRIMLGSTSDYLAHHAQCPLVITPNTVTGSDTPDPTEATAPVS